MSTMKEVLDALRSGSFALVYDADGREEETDFVIPSVYVRPESISEMRRNGGGLICTTVTAEHADKMGLPYLTDVLNLSGSKYPLLQELTGGIPYDAKSAFSITINHRDSYTGITDNDRSLCITSLGNIVAEIGGIDNPIKRFSEEFRSPGHVHLLRASPGLLDDRQGHTELSTALCMMADVPPSATICEMMGEGSALSKEEARRYALENGWPFIEGKDVSEAWKRW